MSSLENYNSKYSSLYPQENILILKHKIKINLSIFRNIMIISFLIN